MNASSTRAWQRAWETRVLAWRQRPDVAAWLASLPPTPAVAFGPILDAADEDGELALFDAEDDGAG